MNEIRKITIRENALDIIGNIRGNCENSNLINIVIASKKRPIEEMIYAASFFKSPHFGENIAQEFRDKYDENYKWDFIGQIQTNKIKYLVGKANFIQSVCNLKTCDEIQRLSQLKNLKQSVFIQINAGKEQRKAGLSFEETIKFHETISTYSRIEVKGLMIVTPIEEKEKDIYFKNSKLVFDELKNKDKKIEYLSMGMSNDYIEAINNGSNMVRLGRAIFQ